MNKIQALWEQIPSAIREGLKEGSRVIALAVVSYIITTGVISLLVEAILGAHVDPTTKLYIVGLVTTGLRSIDKWLHEVGKAKEEITGETSNLTAGITRF
jgi:hypothetical protein